jgi:F5/8 type C domain
MASVSFLVFLAYSWAPGQSAPQADPSASETALKSIGEECYAAIGPALQLDDGEMTPGVREAYLKWAEGTVLKELVEAKQVLPDDCLSEVNADATLREAIFGAVFPPDPSILQNYAILRERMSAGFMTKYQSLAIAVAVAKRTKGVERNGTPALSRGTPSLAFSENKDFGRDYQPELWADYSLEPVASASEKEFIQGMAGFMKKNQVSALDLYQSGARQQQLIAFLQARNMGASFIGRIKTSVEFGEWLKNAMVVLGQRPGAREPKPDTVTWLRYLASVYEATPASTPTIDGTKMSWPLFPIDRAPWPLLMSLARPVPMGETRYIWEAFQGEHGPDRYHTYGPFLDAEGTMPLELQPSPWFWDAWPDRIVHGGECVPISQGTMDLYSCLAKPAVWAGQPVHANLLSFQFVDGAWTAEIEQSAPDCTNITFAQWYFDEDRGTALHFRDLYYWPGSEYHLGLALGMNRGLESYMDTRIAATVFKILPPDQQSTVGVKLLKSAAQANPFNPEIWYRLAQQTTDAMAAVTLAQNVLGHSPDPLKYWQTTGEFVTRFSVLSLPHPSNEADLRSVYRFLQNVHGLTPEDLEAYMDKSSSEDASSDAVVRDQGWADQGDPFGLLRMGQRYRDGDGVPQDESEAVDFLTRSAAQGDTVAALALDRLQPRILLAAGDMTVSASTTYSGGQDVQHLVDGSGMLDVFHDDNGSAFTMWTSISRPPVEPPAPSLEPSPAWVRFDFSKPQKFDSMLIWNDNQNTLTNRGFRRTRIYGSSDGNAWFPLTSPGIIELPQAHNYPFEQPVSVENAAAASPIKSVIIAADSTGGNFGGDCFGLSAARFVVKQLGPCLPANVVTVAASTTWSSGQIAQHLVDGSGMRGVLHDNDQGSFTMWTSRPRPAPQPPAPGLAPSPAWVKFDFATPQKIDSLLIWNDNQHTLTNRGFRKTHIYGSSDGARWFPLTSPDEIELPQADGNMDERPITIENAAAARSIRSVIIAADSVDGNYGGDCYGLSAVRFVVR